MRVQLVGSLCSNTIEHWKNFTYSIAIYPREAKNDCDEQPKLEQLSYCMFSDISNKSLKIDCMIASRSLSRDAIALTSVARSLRSVHRYASIDTVSAVRCYWKIVAVRKDFSFHFVCITQNAITQHSLIFYSSSFSTNCTAPATALSALWSFCWLNVSLRKKDLSHHGYLRRAASKNTQ